MPGRRQDREQHDDRRIVRAQLAEGNVGSHNDGFQCTGDGRNILVAGNTILGPYQNSVSALKFSTNNGPITDVVVRDNYLSGGTYTIYVEDKGTGVRSADRVRGGQQRVRGRLVRPRLATRQRSPDPDLDRQRRCADRWNADARRAPRRGARHGRALRRLGDARSRW
ncbi:MAG: hypothetical protein U5R31_15755 [Acidimicrobiia bacterium]|nr:hypothetical protein [Acidimicrobiia bacterium]